MQSIFWDAILMLLIVVGIGGVIPCVLTGWNIYNLFAKTPKKPELAFWLTLGIGGMLYMLLFVLMFETAGEWYEVIYDNQLHNSISSRYAGSVAIPAVLGVMGMILLYVCNTEKLPPLVSAFAVAAIVVFNVVQIAFAVQIFENINDIVVFLWFYVYHFNLFLLSVTGVRMLMKRQIQYYEQVRRGGVSENGEDIPKLGRLYRLVNSASKYTALVFVCLFFLIAVLEILFILFGQGMDAPIKAFTDTADWTFSKQIPPPPMEYEGHYLCTVAAGGHKSVVKPLRYGKRRGQEIVVNRQLCIANAFEDYLKEKLPRFHKVVRSFYDTYGYPVSKYITTPVRADIVYVLMKPVEWSFLVFLYLFDRKPEERIGRQYR